MTKQRWALLVALSFIVALGMSVAAAPTIYTEETTYDFGEVLEGYTVSHVFVLENTGTTTLQIVRVRTSCGCTTTALATSYLEPGESVELEVLIDTAGFNGSISKSIYVYSNDPAYANGYLVLRMRGVVNRAQSYHISVTDLNYLFYVLVDLRDPDAYAAGHLMGAINIPYSELATSLDLLPTGVLMIVYDQTGELGDLAAQMLVGANYPEARSLFGGFDQWLRSYSTRYVTPAGSAPTIPDGWTQGAIGRHHLPVGDMNYLMYVLVDIRSAEEFDSSHLMGALHIPYAELADRMAELPKGVTLILYDQTGASSDVAAQMLQSAGYGQARSLLGGLAEWLRTQGNRFVIGSDM